MKLKDKNIHISLVELAVMDRHFINKLKDWRCYRIEYVQEGHDPEDIIWLPPNYNSDDLEKVLNDIEILYN